MFLLPLHPISIKIGVNELMKTKKSNMKEPLQLRCLLQQVIRIIENIKIKVQDFQILEIDDI